MRWLLPLALLACGGPNGADTAEDPVCSEVDGPVTWDNFGRGFTTQHCNSCHSASTLDRHDAPEAVVFDTEADVFARRDRVLIRAAGQAATMPPEGGVSSEDRLLLEVWLSDCH